MLIELLKNESTLSRYFCSECQENGVAAQIDVSVTSEDLLIIKVDRYYNHLIQDPDCSPDCLIIQRCNENQYSIYIVELKNISSPKHFKISDILAKFQTCLGDFMETRFGNYFHNRLFAYKNIHLLFISDPYDFKANPSKQANMQGHKLDVLMAQRIPKYFGKHLYIEYKVPNPTIKSCR